MNPFREARKNLGLTMHEVCSKAGVALATLQSLEKGVTTNPPAKILNFYQKKGIDPERLKKAYAEYLKQIREA